MSQSRGIIFQVWGEKYVAEVGACIEQSRLPDCPIFLVTDETTRVELDHPRLQVIRGGFKLDGKARKSELVRFFPKGVDTLLFLDVDTRVVGDISLGFDKAERHGIAMAQAPHYSLDYFKSFSVVMREEGLEPRGQLLYNSGVIFFRLEERVLKVWDLAHELAHRHPDAPWGDQTYLTLAMELLEFNPYTLTTGYNHRAFGELISGETRIWHSYHPVPEGLNESPGVFPRRFEDGRIVRHRISVPRRL